MNYNKIDEGIYYVPLKRALVVGTSNEAEIDFESIFQKVETDDPYIDTYRPDGHIYNSKYSAIPISIQIYPTSGCNLRCKYCFSDSGNTRTRDLSIEKIRFFISEAFKTAYIAKISGGKTETVEIQFCGGGEPTFNWTAFENAVDYIEDLSRKYNIPHNIKLTSNCCYSNRAHIEYIAEHINHLHVSFDGCADIQNFQRPMANGNGSYDLVFAAVKTLFPLIKKRDGICSLRPTVTNYSVGRMEEVTEMFCREFPMTDFIQFEPLNWVRKTDREGDLFAPEPHTFAQNFLKCCAIGRRRGVNIVSSFGEITLVRPRGSFCDSVLGYSLVLNHDGDIVNCAEASSDNPRTYKKFLVGHLDDDLNIEWFNTKHIMPQNKCNPSCYAWYHCGGGCLHSIVDYEVNKEYRCELAREIVYEKLKAILNNNAEDVFVDCKSYDLCDEGVKVYVWSGNKVIKPVC